MLVHWRVALRILSYIKKAPRKGLFYKNHRHLKVIGYSDSGYAGDRGDRKSMFGYCTFVSGNLVTWRIKKYIMVSISSVEAEYRVMAQCVWDDVDKFFLDEVGVSFKELMLMYCDNQATIYIISNPVSHVFHERTKHIEVDCHFVWNIVLNGLITTPYTLSFAQLADVFTKFVSSTHYRIFM